VAFSVHRGCRTDDLAAFIGVPVNLCHAVYNVEIASKLNTWCRTPRLSGHGDEGACVAVPQMRRFNGEGLSWPSLLRTRAKLVAMLANLPENPTAGQGPHFVNVALGLRQGKVWLGAELPPEFNKASHGWPDAAM